MSKTKTILADIAFGLDCARGSVAFGLADLSNALQGLAHAICDDVPTIEEERTNAVEWEEESTFMAERASLKAERLGRWGEDHTR